MSRIKRIKRIERTKPMNKEWTLRELAAETGVPERTIRFYISRGLVDPPLRGGRGAAYGAGHKARLEAIRELQAKGMMLAEISHAIALASSEPAPIEQVGVPAQARPGGWQTFTAKADAAPQDTDAKTEAGLAKRMESRSIRESVLQQWIPGVRAHDSAHAPVPASAAAPSLPEPAVWRSYPVAPDVMVMVRAEAGPWRTKRILSALRQFSAHVAPESEGREPRDKQETSKMGNKNDKDDKENQGE